MLPTVGGVLEEEEAVGTLLHSPSPLELSTTPPAEEPPPPHGHAVSVEEELLANQGETGEPVEAADVLASPAPWIPVPLVLGEDVGAGGGKNDRSGVSGEILPVS